MTISHDREKWIRGALLAAAAAAAAGCQAELAEDPAGDPAAAGDVAAALAALPDATVLLAAADGVPRYVVGDLGAELAPVLRAFRLSEADLVLRRAHTDERGARHLRYDQRIHGLPVIGGDLAVHVDAAGAIFGVNGTARGDRAPAPGAIAISEAAAALRVAGDPRWADLAGRAVTGARRVYLQTEAGARHLAHELIVEGARGADPVRDRVYVDAAGGEIVAVHPTIHHAMFRKIYVGAALARSEGDPPTGDPDVDGAYDHLGTTYRAYHHFFGRDSYDNAGAQLTAQVHYASNYCNAFWNGTQMVYGDGDPAQNCYPLARALDVTAHELAHAVTQYESDLVLAGEPGGLNESYSDMFGAFAEAFGDGGSNGTLEINGQTFLMGDEVLPPFIRDMCDPAADGASRDIWTPDLGTVDVHHSSGPNNLAFCLLTKGGTHPRGKTTTNVPAIGLEKAARIFYKANTDLLTSSSNYAAMRTAAIQAAALLGYDEATQDAVACAYAAIAVGAAPGSCGSSADGVLASGVPITGLTDDAVGNFRYWSLTVPAGQATLTFAISGGTGDADLYVNNDGKPSERVYQCRPYLAGNAETCTFTSPPAGVYWVGLRTYAPYASLTLTGTYTTSTPTDPYLTSGVPVSNLSGTAGSARYYRIAVPAGRTLTIRISGGTGDADLYTRFGSRPTLTTYACRPYRAGNTETCLHVATSVAGDWYVMVRGYAAYAGVQLIGSF